MRAGIVAEGRADLAVLANILQGALGIDRESLQFIRPEYYLDETDLHEQREPQFGSCALVRQECLDRTKIRDFFDSPVDEGERFVVIHVDTAEVGRADAVLDVTRPGARESDAVGALRQIVIAKIDEWLSGEFAGMIRYAVAIEETEAWVLALYSPRDTTRHQDPKKALHRWINESSGWSQKKRAQLFQMSEYDRHDELSKDLRRAAKLRAAAAQNRSLALFVESL